ncbi:uncharacterized protein IL334_001440 [Kwoniella shivajii]|uniref:Uncharacterized protein n=1 Tax=Kwoniella shivajii TaxID=564305 RepID=A0ABZ1CRW8_9TREE|nr:hypothetical protein IL334_001440 [Kwoniella shivajii]
MTTKAYCTSLLRVVFTLTLLTTLTKGSTIPAGYNPYDDFLSSQIASTSDTTDCGCSHKHTTDSRPASTSTVISPTSTLISGSFSSAASSSAASSSAASSSATSSCTTSSAVTSHQVQPSFTQPQASFIRPSGEWSAASSATSVTQVDPPSAASSSDGFATTTCTTTDTAGNTFYPDSGNTVGLGHNSAESAGSQDTHLTNGIGSTHSDVSLTSQIPAPTISYITTTVFQPQSTSSPPSGNPGSGSGSGSTSTSGSSFSSTTSAATSEPTVGYNLRFGEMLEVFRLDINDYSKTTSNFTGPEGYAYLFNEDYREAIFNVSVHEAVMAYGQTYMGQATKYMHCTAEVTASPTTMYSMTIFPDGRPSPTSTGAACLECTDIASTDMKTASQA